MKLIKATATVAGLTGLSRIAGFVRDILMAAVLGAGPLADAFFVALKLPNFFRRITAEGAFSVSFVPLYSEALEKEGRARADAFAGNAMVVMFWVLAAFTLVIMWQMPIVIDLVAPGFSKDPERYHLAVTLSRITFPYLLMMSVASLLGGVLNAHNRFAPFAAAPIFFNLALIGILLVAWRFKSAAHALAWGVLIAGVLQFVFLFLFARRENIHLPVMRPKIDARIKKLFKLMGPGVVGAGLVQINLFVDMIIGSFLPIGSISYLYYADRLNQLPLSTIGIAIGTALLPMLSRAVGAGNEREAENLFNRALEMVFFLGLPAACGLFVLAQPIIYTLFHRGAFSAEAAHYTALVLQGYVIGLPAYIGAKVFATAFWSHHDTATPVKVTLIVTVINTLLALTFVRFIGVAGIALATGLVGWLQILMMVIPMRRKSIMRFDARFLRAAPRLFFATALMGAVVAGLNIFIFPWMMGGFFQGVIGLCALIACGMAVYAGAVFGTGALEIRDIRNYLKK